MLRPEIDWPPPRRGDGELTYDCDAPIEEPDGRPIRGWALLVWFGRLNPPEFIEPPELRTLRARLVPLLYGRESDTDGDLTTLLGFRAGCAWRARVLVVET